MNHYTCAIVVDATESFAISSAASVALAFAGRPRLGFAVSKGSRRLDDAGASPTAFMRDDPGILPTKETASPELEREEPLEFERCELLLAVEEVENDRPLRVKPRGIGFNLRISSCNL